LLIAKGKLGIAGVKALRKPSFLYFRDFLDGPFLIILIKEKLRISYHNQPIQINFTSIILAMEKRRKENEKVDFNYCWNHFN
jgi:hypothetical protein